MKIVAVAGFAPITKNVLESAKLYRDRLGFAVGDVMRSRLIIAIAILSGCSAADDQSKITIEDDALAQTYRIALEDRGIQFQVDANTFLVSSEESSVAIALLHEMVQQSGFEGENGPCIEIASSDEGVPSVGGCPDGPVQ